MSLDDIDESFTEENVKQLLQRIKELETKNSMLEEKLETYN